MLYQTGDDKCNFKQQQNEKTPKVKHIVSMQQKVR